MNDEDMKLLYVRMDELNRNIIQLGKGINVLNKTQKEVSSKLDNLPKEVFSAAGKAASKVSLDDLKLNLDDISITTDDIQKTVTTIYKAFTMDKVTK